MANFTRVTANQHRVRVEISAWANSDKISKFPKSISSEKSKELSQKMFDAIKNCQSEDLELA